MMMQSPPSMPPSYEDFNYTADIDPNDPFFTSILASPPPASPFNPPFHMGTAGTNSGPSFASSLHHNHLQQQQQQQQQHQHQQHHHYNHHTIGAGTSATLLASPSLPSPFGFGGSTSLPPTHDDHHDNHNGLHHHQHHHHQHQHQHQQEQQQQQQHQQQEHEQPLQWYSSQISNTNLHHSGVPTETMPTGSLFDASEQSFLLSFLSGFDGEFNPQLPDNMPSFAEAAARVAAQGPPRPISPPPLSSRPPPKPSRTFSSSSSSLTPTPGATQSPAAMAQLRQASISGGHAPPGATGGVGSSRRELLTDTEKRQNHILSEQRRRNYIREGFKELVELLDLGRKAGAKGLGLGAAKGTGVEEELWAAALANGTVGEDAFDDELGANGQGAGSQNEDDDEGDEYQNGSRDDDDGRDGEEDEYEDGDLGQRGPRKRVATGGAGDDSDRPRSRAKGSLSAASTSKDGKLSRSRSGRRTSTTAGAGASSTGSKTGAAPPLPLGALGGKGKGRGRGGSAGGGAGSKSAVLFQAVDLIRWLNARNEDLEGQCNALEGFKAAKVAQSNPHYLQQGQGQGGEGEEGMGMGMGGPSTR